MKYNKILSAALIVFAATSCNKYLPEDMSNRNLEPMTIAGSETKTVFNQADGTVKWTTGDVIAIFDNLGGRNGFTNTADAPSSFSGNVTAGTTKFWGVYPGTRVESFSNGTAILKLPNIQTIAGNTFAEDLNLSVTTGNKTPGEPIVEGIKFHNVCGMVSFTLPARVSKVSFTASNRALAGNLSVNCENCTATVIDDDEASNTVSMSGNFPAGSRFYFVVAPGKIEGFSIEVSTAKGSIYGKGASQGEIDASAGKLVNLPEINYTDGTVTATAGHIYDQDTKVLTGSTLTVNHGIPQAIWKDVTAINNILRYASFLAADY